MSNKQLTELGEEVSKEVGGLSKLPLNWAYSPIGNICNLNNGRAFKPTEWSDTGLPIVRIQNLNKANAPFNYFKGDFDEKYHLKGGELLFAWSGTPGTSFGAHVWKGGEAVLNQHIFRIDFNESYFDKRFFRHAINQTLDRLIDIAHGGVGLRHVTKGKFESTEIVLPPLLEQKRIADKLDATLARVDACRERLARVTPLLKRFRQSVLAAATSGQLTADWREQQNINAAAYKAVYASHAAAEQVSSLCPTGPTTITADLSSGIGGGNLQTDKFQLLKTIQRDWTSYPVVHLSQVADSRLGKMLDKAKNSGQLTPYLGNINVRWFAFNTADLQEIKIEERDVNELSLRKNDVLICEGGEPGRCAIWEHEGSNIIFQKALHRVRPLPEKLLSTWLVYSIKYAAESRRLDEYFTGTTIKHFTGRSLAKFELPLPPLPEQTEIVRRVETLFAFADRLEARLASANAAANRLTPSLLAKAFRGELVPQDPSDEPASELLKRLAAQREATASKPKAKKPAV